MMPFYLEQLRFSPANIGKGPIVIMNELLACGAWGVLDIPRCMPKVLSHRFRKGYAEGRCSIRCSEILLGRIETGET